LEIKSETCFYETHQALAWLEQGHRYAIFKASLFELILLSFNK